MTISPNGPIDVARIESALRSHQGVKDAVVVVRDGPEPSAIGFVTFGQPGSDEPMKTAVPPGSKDETRQVRLWQSVFDRGIYTAFDKTETVGRDFTGWVSAYNGVPLDIGEMNEWLDDTIATIVGSHGNQSLDVLELGTGSGMVLFNLPKSLGSYHGLDPAKRAVEFVNATTKSFPNLDGKVHIYQGAATDLHLLKSVSPNIAIINSVAQYFPSPAYLTKVVKGLLGLDSMRTIFFGDVRSQALVKEFMVSKAFDKMGVNATKEGVREEMAQAQSEFFVDPAFFTSLPSQFPDQIEHVQILPKRMKAHNELVQYRFAAVMHVRNRHPVAPQLKTIHEVEDDQWIDFVHQKLDRESLLRRLRDSALSDVAVSNIPYRETIFERHIIDSVTGTENEGVDWVSSARQKSTELPSFSALGLVSLAKEAGYQVEISWARQHSQRGGLDAIFHHHQPSNGDSVWFRFPTDHQGRPADTFTNQPLQKQAKQPSQQKDQLATQKIQEALRAQLPLHLVPKDIILLEKLPINASGDVDHHALAARV
ncbi:enniatin synthetase [Penicillium viridicatum]|nr:enniatin synthetase [Penicillium viridicatum]